MLHKIVGAFDTKTLQPSEHAKHRIGKIVHIGSLSLNHPVLLYHESGIIKTSPVKSWTEKNTGSVIITTENTVYYLENHN